MFKAMAAALAIVMMSGSASALTLVNIRSQDAPKYDPHSNTSSQALSHLVDREERAPLDMSGL